MAAPQYEGIGFLVKAGKQRLFDAKSLMSSGKHERERGAAYICGYSVECLLKAVLISRAPGGPNTLTRAADAYRQNNPSFPSLATARAHDIGFLIALC